MVWIESGLKRIKNNNYLKYFIFYFDTTLFKILSSILPLYNICLHSLVWINVCVSVLMLMLTEERFKLSVIWMCTYHFDGLSSGSDKCPIYVILSAAWLFAAGRFLLMKQVCGLERTDIGIACGNSASWKNSICEQRTCSHLLKWDC